MRWETPKRAFEETTRFWTIHRNWATFAVPGGAMLYRVLRNGKASVVNDIPGTIGALLMGFAVAWVGTLLINLVRSPFLLLRESEKKVETLESGIPKDQPDVTARWVREDIPLTTYSRRPVGPKLMLQNTGRRLAVNVSALPLEFTIPESVREGWAKEAEQFGHNKELPTTWRVEFSTIDKLPPGGNEEDLTYIIDNIGALQSDDVSHILRACIGWDAKTTFQLTLVFSDTGTPMRTWHTHYKMEFYLYAKPGRIISTFLGFGEVLPATMKCSRCQQ